jgi:hypothetical protein
MASTEVMHAGVCATILLNKISTLLEKIKEKIPVSEGNCIQKRNHLGGSCIPDIIKELASEDTELYKNHLRMLNHNIFGLYTS